MHRKASKELIKAKQGCAVIQRIIKVAFPKKSSSSLAFLLCYPTAPVVLCAALPTIFFVTTLTFGSWLLSPIISAEL
jgi:hypothetical protein